MSNEVFDWKRRLLLLWLAGVSLRLTILAVPPVVSHIHAQLGLDETAVGVLTSLPLILLAAAAIPGSLIVARLGARTALLAGLMVVAAGGAARGLGPSAPVLFALTFVMGAGVAISQPALPSLVAEWLPRRVGLATGVFSNGLLIGEVAPVALTGPFLLMVMGGSWPLVLAAWSAPVLLTAVCVAVLAPASDRSPDQPRARWWPDWHDPDTWRLGGVLGGASAAYWGANAFIPDFLRAHHHGAYVSAALTSLNLIQLPASTLVAVFGSRMIARRLPLALSGVLTVISTIGLVVLPPAWLVVDAGLLGFSTALVFVLALALPPVLAEHGDAHRLSAAMFTVSYTCPFAGSFLGGGLWDLTGRSQLAFTPVLAGGLLIIGLPAWLRLSAGNPRSLGDMAQGAHSALSE